VDEIAGLILTPGGTPIHTFGDYTKNASVKSKKKKFRMPINPSNSFWNLLKPCSSNNVNYRTYRAKPAMNETVHI
jgi:DNA-binding ferritin-like protein